VPSLSLVVLPESQWQEGTAATLEVVLQGFAVGKAVELSFWEADALDGQLRPQRLLGEVKGKVAASPSTGTPRFTVEPAEPPPPRPKPAAPAAGDAPAPPRRVAFRLLAPERANMSAVPPLYFFDLADDKHEVDEGDWWELIVECKDPALTSPEALVARVRRQLGRDKATYDWHDGHDVAFFNDGSTDAEGSAGAFAEMMKAIAAAQKFVFIADWSFHPLFQPTGRATASLDQTIGAILRDKAKAGVQVAIHTWAHTNAGAADVQNDNADDVLDSLCGGKRPDKLLWRATAHDNTFMTHHQKFVVVDAPGSGRSELMVFFGGLDLTRGRFDWNAHPVSPRDPLSAGFKRSWGTPAAKPAFAADDWYNAELVADSKLPRRFEVKDKAAVSAWELGLPRQPWHDVHAKATGPVAWDFVREFVGRWMRDPSITYDADGDDGTDSLDAIWKLYKDLLKDPDVVQQRDGRTTGDFAMQLCRSQIKSHWGARSLVFPKADDKAAAKHFEFPSKLGSVERSIQEAYLQAIAQADRFIYIETQYLIGSSPHWLGGAASGGMPNRLPEKVVARIAEKVQADEDFHAYFVVPLFAEGDPTGGGGPEIRRNEWETMKYLATSVRDCKKPDGTLVGQDWSRYVSFYFLANWTVKAPPAWLREGSRQDRLIAHERYMVYVHTKLMIVDDRFAFLGSANLNERSLAGDHDSEVGCALWPMRGREDQCQQKLRDLRQRLWQEHFGTLPDGWESPELVPAINAVANKAWDNYKAFRQMDAPAAGHLCGFPAGFDGKGQFAIMHRSRLDMPEKGVAFMPDPDQDLPAWHWTSTGSLLIRRLGFAE
jgi:phospholipase D1/2